MIVHKIKKFSDTDLTGREREHYFSRVALKECMLLFIPSIEISQLEISNHLHLKAIPQYIVSISHNKDYAAAVVTNDPIINSIGIDIEARSRLISPKIIEKIQNSLDIIDSNNRLLLIQIWSMKEAAFKALSPIDNSIIILNDVWINCNNCNFGRYPQTEVLGKLDTFKEGPLTVTIAKHFNNH